METLAIVMIPIVVALSLLVGVYAQKYYNKVVDDGDGDGEKSVVRVKVRHKRFSDLPKFTQKFLITLQIEVNKNTRIQNKLSELNISNASDKELDRLLLNSLIYNLAMNTAKKMNYPLSNVFNMQKKGLLLGVYISPHNISRTNDI